MSARGLLRVEGGNLGFWCPGCEGMHIVSVGGTIDGDNPYRIAASGWTFNGNYDAPTFTPSVLVTSGHYQRPGAFDAENPPGSCWCTYNAAEVAAGRQPAPFQCKRCHSFVTDGRIQFLTDSTHKLAGQTVPLVVPP